MQLPDVLASLWVIQGELSI